MSIIDVYNAAKRSLLSIYFLIMTTVHKISNTSTNQKTGPQLFVCVCRKYSIEAVHLCLSVVVVAHGYTTMIIKVGKVGALGSNYNQAFFSSK